MARRLNESITLLETLNRDLEREVARRTVEVQRAADFSALLNAPLGAQDAHASPEAEAAGPDAPVGLGRLLDDAVAALCAGTGSPAGAVMLVREQEPGVPPTSELELARFAGAPPDSFGPPPPAEQLEVGIPFIDGARLVMPLCLGPQVVGCLLLLDVPARDDLLRFVSQGAAQLAIAIANVRAYAALDELAHALRERNEVLADQRDQLSEMNRLKSEFLANVSHELRTPLNAIIGYGELLGGGLYGPLTPEQRHALTGIGESGHGLIQLIDQILDLAKVEAGKMTLQREEVDVAAAVRTVVNEAAALAKDRPYAVRLFAKGEPRLHTDRAKLKQIVTNLVGNAVKFTREGRVDVFVRADPSGGCSIAVEDTGIGIKPEDMGIIFEEFRQVDGSYTREFGGTGLGLAIARRFAGMLGGEITVESTVGVGSTFTVRLPSRAPDSVPSPLPTGRTLRLAAPRTGGDSRGS
jgi:signal transduction histidine kinase